MTLLTFTLGKFLLALLVLGVIAIILGLRIIKRNHAEYNFYESAIFMRKLIESSELSKTAYRNILDAFHDFDTISYRNDKAYKSLWSDFLFKYKDFLPESDQPKIKLIPR